jgi:primary-amine oxidase
LILVSAHPLDPLSAEEQESLVKVARAAWKLDHRHLIAMLQLHEPTKEFLSKYKDGDAFSRFGRITIWDQERAMVSEGVISTSGEVKSYTEIPGAKAPVLAIESERAIEIARKDQRVIDALKKRGINSADDVHMETWPIGLRTPN